MPGGKVELTYEELLALIKRSSLPTLVVEGKDDMIVYRRLEDEYYDKNLSVLSVGGREKVLRLFEALKEAPPKAQVVFFADLDMWVLEGVPEKYHSDNLFFTTGYSIENDVFCDGNLLSYMDHRERIKFGKELECYLKWYALAVDRAAKGDGSSISQFPSDEFFRSYDELVLLRDGENYPQDLFTTFSAGYVELLRGKALMGLILRQLSYPGRHARHNVRAFIEHVAVAPGPKIRLISQKVGGALV